MATNKKITRVEGSGKTASQATWKPTEENKSKATRNRVIAAILWVLAVVAQLIAIRHIIQVVPIKMWFVIVLIVVDLALAIVGSILWKKSNRLDPPSEKNKFLFFLQSQLGLFTAIIAFLPLVIVIFTNKNLDGKQKGILGGIAIAALVAAGLVGTDFNPPSVEQYTQDSNYVKELMGSDYVYWTKSGSKYHLYQDCQHLKGDRTTEIFEGGSVSDAYANNSRIKPTLESLCKTCENRAAKEKGWSPEDLEKAKEKAAAIGGEVVSDVVPEEVQLPAEETITE
ncbi:MAG TPA: hypothetical protein GXZ87_01460 [Bacteroidales bacterium]|nr:hypothetical protein [Bacteroidales bacterium]